MRKTTQGNQGQADSPAAARSGGNRTGMGHAPGEARQAAEGAAAGVPQAAVDSRGLEAARASEARNADAVGSMPTQGRAARLDPELAARVRSAAGGMLLDFLGERLTAERTHARLYETLLAKLEASGSAPGRPERAALALLREQALNRFHLLTSAIERLGGDATAVTPSADLTATVNAGVLQAMNDQRITLAQGMKLMVGALVVAKDAWETLVDIAERVGVQDMGLELQHAMDQVEENLASMRTWLRRALEHDGDFDHDAPADTLEAASP